MSNGIPTNPTTLPAFALNAARALSETPTPAAERAKVAELSQQFEAMLMLQMVQQMRKSLLDETESSEGFGGSTMQETFDSEFSGYLARSGGVGLGALMTRTLDERAGAADVSARESADRPVSFDLHTASPALPLTPSAPATWGGRSTDMVDARTSVELPLATPVTSPYGWRSDPFTGEARFHRGVDLRATYGTEVPAAAPGTVVSAGERGTYGNLVVVRDDQGIETRYAHLSATLVKEGDVIAAGTPIGRVGSTGRSAAPHLHFEVLVNGERVDPATWAGRVGRGPLKSDDGPVD
ncbi:MAG: peptidoglycan DD-metalloendopeptidase family protein [Vicinamibacteraceae bacterium]